MTNKSSLRHRRERKEAKEAKEKAKAAQQQAKPKATKDDDESKEPLTWRQLVFRHPTTYLVFFVGVPYLCWTIYRFVVLQHPPSGMRPPVQLEDPRQVLILGPMSSGTSSAANKLSQTSLEIGHEDSDTSWKFVRDGTVSWFHAVRYWPPVANETIRSLHISHFCQLQWRFRQDGLSENYGFGPTLFGTPQYNCSFWHPQFQTCHRHACVQALEREYSCAWDNSCSPRFERTLLQLREPWNIVTSLTAKYCYDAEASSIKKELPSTLQWLLLSLRASNPSQVCVLQLADYVSKYYTNVLTADPSIRRYRIEDLGESPCELMELAGLDQLETTIHGPNHELYRQWCVEKRYQAKEEVQANPINKGRVTPDLILQSLEEEDISYIQGTLQRLYSTLGYENFPTEVW
eukprot:Nitzschia sp. Nitz4//scaffold26_size159584//106292//107503//NITZ4_002502-RA/size159584-processed-gene-0.82-mRNA-1//-1//CDS//3329545115//2112//frame0